MPASDRLVELVSDTRILEAQVVFESENRKSLLVVTADGFLYGFIGPTPLLQRDDGYYYTLTGDGPIVVRDKPDAMRDAPAPVRCEACEQGMRLTPDGLHYQDGLTYRGPQTGATWGVCRFVVARERARRAHP